MFVVAGESLIDLKEKPLKDGTVAPASRDCMLMYLFSWQPAVPQKLGFTLYAGH